MKRSEFIKLGCGSAAALTALPLVHLDAGSDVERWAKRYRATIRQRSGSQILQARPTHSELPTALQELARLADGPLQAKGNTLSGRITGCGILVHLAVS